MKILGEKTILVPFKLKFLPAAWKWVKDKDVNRFLIAVPPKKWKDEVKWLRNSNKDKANRLFAILEKENKKHIGTCGFTKIDKINKKASLGIMIGDKNYWGKGYGTSTITSIQKYGFEKLGLNKIHLTVFTNNPRAQSCYKKCGFREVGLLKEENIKNGKFLDEILMEILKKDFKKQQ